MELMPNFQLHRPTEVGEAVKLHADLPGARYLAGGTDLVVNIRRGIEQPENLIDLTAIEALSAIEAGADGLSLGAGATLEAVAADPVVQADYAAVAQAAAAVAAPTHQQYGTLGGNLCLDTRCIYYNQSEWWRQSNQYCLKNKGEICHVAPGGKQCFAAFSGDVAPALLVFGAEAQLEGPGGSRRIPLSNIYNNDGLNHLNLEPGELLTAVHLPKPDAASRSAYEKIRTRGSIDFPLAGAAVRLELDGAKVKALDVALTGVKPYPQMVKGTDALEGKPLNDAALDELREIVRKHAKPMRTTTVAPWYRRRVAGALARRITARLAQG